MNPTIFVILYVDYLRQSKISWGTTFSPKYYQIDSENLVHMIIWKTLVPRNKFVVTFYDL